MPEKSPQQCETDQYSKPPNIAVTLNTNPDPNGVTKHRTGHTGRTVRTGHVHGRDY